MFSAILYNSCTGSCKRYAQMLSARLHLPAVDVKKFKGRKDGKVIYVSWLFAAGIVGYKKVSEKYNVGAVVQVGMSPVTAGSEAAGRAKNDIPAEVPLFPLQGGFYIDKLPLPLKLIMKLKCKGIAEGLSSRSGLNDQEKATLKMAKTGSGDPASWECVDDIVAWCKAN